VLARFSLSLVTLVVLPAIAARAMWRWQITGHVNRQRVGGTDAARADAWKSVALDWTGGKEVRTFGLVDFSLARSGHLRLLVSAPRWRSEARGAALQWIIAVIVGPPLAVTYAWVAWSAVHGEISVALLATVFSAAWSVLRAMGPRDAFDIEGALPAVRALARLEKLLGVARNAPPSRVEPQARSDAAPPLIRFEDVGFTYPGRDRPVLEGVDLEIRPGELLALVGLNGAGKSTLIKLLCGLLRPDGGRITADGTDLAEADPRAWRRRLAVVWQDFIQYPLTAEENVVLGRPSHRPDPAELADATAEAHLAPLLDRLPNGWHTPLSRSRSGGVELSGGEWQQIVLARALYALHAGARVLVMDEPTAHLDVRTEFEVFSRLAGQRGRISVLLISHRLSTVRQADRIVLMEGSRIAESGTHDELMRQGGAYARMFALQAERFRGADLPEDAR
jgi:ABC-type multidrug transport system fused ATPase/permease subunit